MEEVLINGGGKRFNDGKPPVELVPPEAIWAMAAVLGAGMKKYGPRNWEAGMSWTICYGCLLRHLLRWMQGEELDRESGLSHMAHVLTNAAFLVAYQERQAGTDDRPVFVRDVEGTEAKP